MDLPIIITGDEQKGMHLRKFETTMRKLKTTAVLVVACLIPVHLLACQPSAYAVQSKWRKLSRHARILVDDNDISQRC